MVTAQRIADCEHCKELLKENNMGKITITDFDNDTDGQTSTGVSIDVQMLLPDRVNALLLLAYGQAVEVLGQTHERDCKIPNCNAVYFYTQVKKAIEETVARLHKELGGLPHDNISHPPGAQTPPKNIQTPGPDQPDSHWSE